MATPARSPANARAFLFTMSKSDKLSEQGYRNKFRNVKAGNLNVIEQMQRALADANQRVENLGALG